MNSISLSVYQITLNKHLKKDELENLSNFDGGKNFLKLADTLFNSWHDNLTQRVVKDKENKKVSRLKKDSNNNLIYHLHQTCIEGIIESGEYGTQEEIINIETGEVKYTKTKDDAALVPFYFMIYIEPNKTKGFLILERIGNIGIYSLLEQSIREFIAPQMADRYTLNIVPYIVPQILNINLSAVSGAKKVVLRGVDNSQFKDIQPTNNLTGCTTEVSFIAPRNKFIQEVHQLLASFGSSGKQKSYKVNNIECQDVAFELDINGSRRTISVAKMTSIGMNIDITKQIQTDSTGYPSYKSLSDQANIILSYLIK